MYNNYKRGTEASNIYESFIQADEELDTATSNFKDAATEACDALEQMEIDFDELTIEKDELEVRVEELEGREPAIVACVGVLRKLLIFISNLITDLENKYGPVDTPTTTLDGSEQPKKG